MARHSAATSGPNETFRRIAFPSERRLVLDTLHLGHRKPMMHGLLEIEVTRARRLLHEYRERTGQSLSFTAFVLTCVGKAVAAYPEVHAVRDWRDRLVFFDDVDATTIIEVNVDGRRFPLAHVVQAVNRREARDIHDEIRSVQASGVQSLEAGTHSTAALLKLPGPLRRLAFRGFLASPLRTKRRISTVLVTAVGMFGQGGGWGLSAPGVHDLSIVVGGITRRSAPKGDEPTSREVRCLTLSANHELVDGAPFARFASKLTNLLESAAALDSSPPPSGPGVPHVDAPHKARSRLVMAVHGQTSA